MNKLAPQGANSAQPHHVDLHVGALIRTRRKALGISQSELADSLGLTFQQVQKYETGANRVSAGRLFEVAQRLQVEMAYFFEGLEQKLESRPYQKPPCVAPSLMVPKGWWNLDFKSLNMM